MAVLDNSCTGLFANHGGRDDRPACTGEGDIAVG
jgi:hypothetical protein